MPVAAQVALLGGQVLGCDPASNFWCEPNPDCVGVIPLVRFFSRFVTKIVGRVAYVGF